MSRTQSIDWNALASDLGCITHTEGGWNEAVNTGVARRALEQVIGSDVLRSSVDHYVSGRPGAELARGVLWLLHPASAMDRCHEIYLTSPSVEDRRAAVELLRVVADERVLAWVPSYLADPDPQVQVWAIGIVDQLLFSNLAEIDDCEAVLQDADAHANENVRDKAREIRAANG